MKVVPAQELKNYLGQEVGVSDWFEVTQERINKFADATNDHQFIHVDPEMAKNTPWGTTIAHGFLTLSLLPYLSAENGIIPENIQMAVNYGTDKVRFLEAVPVDSKIRGRFVLSDVQEKPGNRWLLKSDVTIEIEGKEKPAAIAETLALFVTTE